MTIGQLLLGLWAMLPSWYRLLASFVVAGVVRYHGYRAVIFQINVTGPFNLNLTGPLRFNFASTFHVYLAQVYFFDAIPWVCRGIIKLLNVVYNLLQVAPYWSRFLEGSNVYLIFLILRATNQIWTAAKTGNFRYTWLVLQHHFASLFYRMAVLWIVSSFTAGRALFDQCAGKEEMTGSNFRWLVLMAIQIVSWLMGIVLPFLKVLDVKRAQIVKVLSMRIRMRLTVWKNICLRALRYQAVVEDLQSPDKFHYFTRLPKELQVKIFKLAILPRTIKVDASIPRSKLDKILFGKWTLAPTIKTHIPICNPDPVNHGLLEACKDSRKALLQARSKSAFVQLYVHGVKIYFDSQHDTVMVTAGLSSFLELRNVESGQTSTSNPSISPDLSGLLNLTVTFNDLWKLGDGGNATWLLNLTCLEKLIVIVEADLTDAMAKRYYMEESTKKLDIVLYLESQVLELWRRQMRLHPGWREPKLKFVNMMIDE